MMGSRTEKIDIAEGLIKSGRYREAIALLEELHAEMPQEESVLMMLSLACYDSGDAEQAEKYLRDLFDRELRRKVFTGFAFDELVRIYKQEKKTEKLVDICETAADAQPDNIALLLELGNAYLQSGNAEKARQAYEKLVALESDNAAFHCLLGEALFAAGMEKECEEIFLKAAEIDAGQSDRFFFKLAVMFYDARKLEDAARLIRQCITVNASNPLYYCFLGDVLIGSAKISEALAAYRQAMDVDPSNAGAYYNRLGNALMKAGYFPEAMQSFQSAIGCEPARPYFSNLAAALKSMGLHDQAEEILSGLGDTQ